MTKQYILGIDPGLEGACALLSTDGQEVDWFKMPTKTEIPGTNKRIIEALKLKEMLEEYNILTCYVEKQAYKNPKLNANYGICLAVLMILKIPYLAIAPSSWMVSLKSKTDLPDIKQGMDKAFTFLAFDELYPEVTLPLKGRTKRDDDIADACLLAKLCQINIELAGE